jgi:hypothetical protein
MAAAVEVERWGAGSTRASAGGWTSSAGRGARAEASRSSPCSPPRRRGRSRGSWTRWRRAALPRRQARAGHAEREGAAVGRRPAGRRRNRASRPQLVRKDMAPEGPAGRGQHLRLPELGGRHGDSLRGLRRGAQPRLRDVGMSHDTAEFAVQSLRPWWRLIGRRHYPRAQRMLLCADGGGATAPAITLGSSTSSASATSSAWRSRSVTTRPARASGTRLSRVN